MLQRLKQYFDWDPDLSPEEDLVISDDYLESLHTTERGHVECFLRFAEDNLHCETAVLAVGSSITRNTDSDNPPNDIDLRILVSPTPDVEFTREHRIKQEEQRIRDYLVELQLFYEREDFTLEHKKVRINNGCIGNWTDYDNEDISFTVKWNSDLPLHISIAGLKAPGSKEYLEKERQYNQGTFAVLRDPYTINAT